MLKDYSNGLLPKYFSVYQYCERTLDVSGYRFSSYSRARSFSKNRYLPGTPERIVLFDGSYFLVPWYIRERVLDAIKNKKEHCK